MARGLLCDVPAKKMSVEENQKKEKNRGGRANDLANRETRIAIVALENGRIFRATGSGVVCLFFAINTCIRCNSYCSCVVVSVAVVGV